MSRNFYQYVKENCHEFLRKQDYQYLIVPLPLVKEFYTFVLQPNVLPIYYEKGKYHFIDPPMNPEFQRFCKEHVLRQESMIQNFFQQKQDNMVSSI
jgi:hypothetical protein